MAGDRPLADRQRLDAETRVGWRMAGLGMEVAAQAAGGALLGWLYDLWRGTGNTGILVGAMIGIAVGLWSLIKGGLKLNRQLDDLAAKRKASRTKGTIESTGSAAQADDEWEDWNNDDWSSDSDDDDDRP